MKFKKHSSLMSHLLLAEKHQQFLLKNVESRPARKIHNIVTSIGLVGSTRFAAAIAEHAIAEVQVAEASCRPPRGSFRKSQHKSPKYVTRMMHHKYIIFQPNQFKGSCHKCGRKGHFTRECRAPPYIVNMYRKLQQLRNQPHSTHRQNYNFDVPSLSNYDEENYITIYNQKYIESGCDSLR